uniref:Uncharacterized protein n=1 Tax=Romanomermis culicivorax TaxID=13658 RepID=A0A915JH58_ROMCU
MHKSTKTKNNDKRDFQTVCGLLSDRETSFSFQPEQDDGNIILIELKRFCVLDYHVAPIVDHKTAGSAAHEQIKFKANTVGDFLQNLQLATSVNLTDPPRFYNHMAEMGYQSKPYYLCRKKI